MILHVSIRLLTSAEFDVAWMYQLCREFTFVESFEMLYGKKYTWRCAQEWHPWWVQCTLILLNKFFAKVKDVTTAI